MRTIDASDHEIVTSVLKSPTCSTAIVAELLTVIKPRSPVVGVGLAVVHVPIPSRKCIEQQLQVVVQFKRDPEVAIDLLPTEAPPCPMLLDKCSSRAYTMECRDPDSDDVIWLGQINAYSSGNEIPGAAFRRLIQVAGVEDSEISKTPINALIVITPEDDPEADKYDCEALMERYTAATTDEERAAVAKEDPALWLVHQASSAMVGVGDLPGENMYQDRVVTAPDSDEPLTVDGMTFAIRVGSPPSKKPASKYIRKTKSQRKRTNRGMA